MNRIKPAVLSSSFAFAVAFAVTVAIAPATASAGGTVLRITGNDIYIDMGGADGVGSGSRLTLYNVVIAKHPVSGKLLRDRFSLGELTVRGGLSRPDETRGLVHPPRERRQAGHVQLDLRSEAAPLRDDVHPILHLGGLVCADVALPR